MPGLPRLVVCDEAKTPIEMADISALFLTTAVWWGEGWEVWITNMEDVAKCVMYDIWMAFLFSVYRACQEAISEDSGRSIPPFLGA